VRKHSIAIDGFTSHADLPNSFVGRVLFDSKGRIREVEDHLRPILNERIERGMNENNENEYVGDESDLRIVMIEPWSH
jgi:hypothetical protein